MSDHLRVLCLLPFPPRLDSQHGGGQVMVQFLKHLQQRHAVSVVYFQARGELPADKFFQENCDHLISVPRLWTGASAIQKLGRAARLFANLLFLHPLWITDWRNLAFTRAVQSVIQRWTPDILQVENHIMGQVIPALKLGHARVVMTIHEPGILSSPYLKDIPASLQSWIHKIDQIAWRRYEPRLFRHAGAVVVFTRRDQAVYEQWGLSIPIERIPFGTQIPERPLDPLGTSPPEILFTGNYMHPPNRDAALRLARSIFPRVLSCFPDAHLMIVGPEPPAELRALANGGIKITGQVPEIRPFLDRAAVVAAPLYSGGGMRVKVLEAVASGKVVVATPLAVEGLDLVAGEHIALAHQDDEMVQVIVDLLGDPDRRVRMAASARHWAKSNLSWDRSIAAFDCLYRRLLEDSDSQKEYGE